MLRHDEIFFGTQIEYAFDVDNEYNLGLELLLCIIHNSYLSIYNYKVAQILIEYGNLNLIQKIFNGSAVSYFQEFFDGNLVEYATCNNRLDVAKYFLSIGACNPRIIKFRFIETDMDWLLYYYELYSQYGTYGLSIMLKKDLYSGTLIFESKESYLSRKLKYCQKNNKHPFKMNPEDLMLKQNKPWEWIKKETRITEDKLTKIFNNSLVGKCSIDVLCSIVSLGYINLLKTLLKAHDQDAKNVAKLLTDTAIKCKKLDIFKFLVKIY
jgi:hypothetical protein